MTPEHRLAFAKCIRSLQTEDAAVQLLEAYESQLQVDRDLADVMAPPELTALEQLPSWSHGDLLTWALEPPIPEAIQDASSILVMREFRLIGDLARASEQAMVRGEVRHAQRIAQALARTWERLRGEQLLSMAFEREGEDS